jgi:hypothetical protein
LAKKVNVNRRHILRLTEKLVESGELYVEHRKENGANNQYIVLLGLTDDNIRDNLVKKMRKSPKQAKEILEQIRGGGKQDEEPESDNDQQYRGVTHESHPCDSCVTPGATHESHHEPSITVKEPSLGADAPPASKKPLTELSDHFIVLSDIPMPTRKSDIRFWWSALRELYNIAGKDLAKAERLIAESYAKLVRDNLTVSGPNSLIKTARSLKAAPPRAAPDIPPGKHEALTRQQAQITAELEAASAGVEAPVNESVLELGKQLNGVFHNAD